MRPTTIVYGDNVEVDLQNFSEEDISLKDIVKSLARTYRFAGTSTQPLTVAQHSSVVAQMMLKCHPYDPEWARAGLIHDFSEAFITDIPTPVKDTIPAIKEFEESIQKTIFKRFSVPYMWMDLVRVRDYEALLTEGRLFTNMTWAANQWDMYFTHSSVPDIRKNLGKEWVDAYVPQGATMVTAHSPEQAEETLLNLCEELNLDP